MRAPTCTATPATLPSATSHSPVWIPARTASPRPRRSSRIEQAHSIARPGPSKVAKNPSPAVSTSSPRCSPRRRRIAVWYRASSSRHARSPSAEACSVEPTRSVKSTVESTRVGGAGAPTRSTSARVSRIAIS